jgi:carboxylesterase type B
VSINYRLGPLGFLAYPDVGIEGNFAIRDQLLALSWIQEEVASFGGDPDKVLLFGQSAGAVDAFVLASLPQAPSLFRAVAMESGGGRDSPNVEWTKPYYANYIQSLGCSPDGDNTVDCLRKVSVTDMNSTLLTQDHGPRGVISASTLISDHEEGNAWLGVVDGKLIPENPGEVGVHVPAIFGSATQDDSLFVLTKYQTAVVNLTEADYNKFLSVSLGPLADAVKKLYPWNAFETYSYQGFVAMTTVYTEVSYKCLAHRRLKLAAAKGIDAWAYSFNHTNSCPWLTGQLDDSQELEVFGPTHTGEIPYLFGQTKNLPRPHGSCNFTEAEYAISDFMMTAWTSMAQNGRPANSSVWPAWTSDGSEGIIIHDAGSPAFLNMTECEFWDKIIDEFRKIDADAAAAAAANGSGSTSPASTSAASTITGGCSLSSFTRVIAFLLVPLAAS